PPCAAPLSALRTLLSNHTATSDCDPLSLPDALPILQLINSCAPRASKGVDHGRRPSRCAGRFRGRGGGFDAEAATLSGDSWFRSDRKSTRLNSSHVKISYAVCCWKKKRHEQARRSSL